MALHFMVVTKPNAGKGLQGARAERGGNLNKVGLGLSEGLRVLSGRSGRDDFDTCSIGRERSTYRLSGPQLSAHLAF